MGRVFHKSVINDLLTYIVLVVVGSDETERDGRSRVVRGVESTEKIQERIFCKWTLRVNILTWTTLRQNALLAYTGQKTWFDMCDTLFLGVGDSTPKHRTLCCRQQSRVLTRYLLVSGEPTYLPTCYPYPPFLPPYLRGTWVRTTHRDVSSGLRCPGVASVVPPRGGVVNGCCVRTS